MFWCTALLYFLNEVTFINLHYTPTLLVCFVVVISHIYWQMQTFLNQKRNGWLMEWTLRREKWFNSWYRDVDSRFSNCFSDIKASVTKPESLMITRNFKEQLPAWWHCSWLLFSKFKATSSSSFSSFSLIFNCFWHCQSFLYFIS